MKSLILEYKESPKEQEINNSVIEYSRKLNLSVIKGTNKPAIQFAYLDTETFTKAVGEPPTDTDKDILTSIKMLLDTRLETKTQGEVTTPDHGFHNLRRLMDTQTLTEAREDTDTDR